MSLSNPFLGNSETDRATAVMDTKYKRQKRPDESDIQQVVAYTVKMETDTALLVYPTKEIDPVNVPFKRLSVRSLSFDVSDDPDLAGKRFLADLSELLP